MRSLLSLAAVFVLILPLSARTYISLGYGLQLNSMLNSTLKSNLQKVILNQNAAPLIGVSGLQPYSSGWSATPTDAASPYAFIGVPEFRLASDWEGLNGRLGIFGSAAGFLPQTNSYYQGNLTLAETNTCTGVDYAKCPLAASGFVVTAGSAAYAAEARSSLRFFNLNVGFTYARKIASVAQGDLLLGGELGLNVQSFAVSTQFVATRCTTGASSPCAANSQSRVFQGELRSQTVYALGPTAGMNLRYERPQSFWFVEASVGATLLFTKLENEGYTNFVAAGTVAFSQTSLASGVDAAQNILAVLPSATLRFGVHL